MTPAGMLDVVFRKVSGSAFAVDYCGERTQCYGDGPPLFTLILHDPHLSDFLKNDIATAFAEAYMAGRIDVRGDLADLVALAIRNASLKDKAPGLLGSVLAKTAGLGRRSQKRQREDVTRHYDLGNDFFRLWLDESMTYSCAYYRTPEDSLEQAQRQKLDHSLRKLRLRPGDSLLDIGCGWGSLAMRAAEAHDVRVTGITLSEEQYALANERIQERGVGDRVEIRTQHYESVAGPKGGFDRIVSIGMIEHVGKPHLAGFTEALWRLLRPGGLALLHVITCSDEGPVNSWMDRHIFPGGYIPSLPELCRHLTNRDFHVWDVENLRPHYRMTLDHWSERFERNVECVRMLYGERFVRMWRLYLRGCSAAFGEGTLDVHQILVSRDKPTGLPITREDLYRA